MLSGYDTLYGDAGDQYQVDPMLLKAQGMVESSLNPNAVSPAGAQGIAQFMPSTARARGLDDPFDPKQAIPAQASLMGQYMTQYGNPVTALMAYHGGQDQSQWGPKTRIYPQLVAQKYAQLKSNAASDSSGNSAPVDPDIAAGQAAMRAITQPATAANSNAPGVDADIAAGQEVVRQALKNAPPPAPPPQDTTGQPDTIAPGIRSFLAPAPNTTYGSVVPLARNNTTGALRLALPESLRGLANGALDLAEGPVTGTVTPAATAALASGLVPGAMSRSLGPPTGFAVRPDVVVGAPADAPPPNPLASQPSMAPNPLAASVNAPAFVPPGSPIPAGIAAAQRPAFIGPDVPNPLSADQQTVPYSMVPNPLASTAVTPRPSPSASSVPAGLTAQEAKEYAAIPEKLPPAPLLPPLTQSAAESRADQLVRHFRSGNEPAVPTDPVPGVVPLLSGVYHDPGLATLERGVAGANPGVWGMRQQANQASRLDFLHNLTGSPDDIAAAEAARETATSPMRDQVFANANPVDPTPVVQQIDSILAGPAGKRDAVQAALTNLRSKIVNDDGTMETDPAQLYGVRKSIGDMLSPLAAGTKADGRQAARELMEVQGPLDDVIESGAPGFQNYMNKYSEMSTPINGMQYLQGLNLTDQAGNINGGALDRAIKSITKQQAQGGVRASSDVTPDQLQQMRDLATSVQRQRFSDTAGKTVGSDTFQNLATNSRVAGVAGNPLISMGMAGAGGLMAGPLGAMGARALDVGAHGITSNAEGMVKRALIERLLNLQGKGVAAFEQK